MFTSALCRRFRRKEKNNHPAKARKQCHLTTSSTKNDHVGTQCVHTGHYCSLHRPYPVSVLPGSGDGTGTTNIRVCFPEVAVCHLWLAAEAKAKGNQIRRKGNNINTLRLLSLTNMSISTRWVLRAECTAACTPAINIKKHSLGYIITVQRCRLAPQPCQHAPYHEEVQQEPELPQREKPFDVRHLMGEVLGRRV